MRDFGHILASTPTTITRAVIRDGAVIVQRFTAPVEIPFDLPGAEDLVMLAEQAAHDAAQQQTAGDAYLAKLARTEDQMPLGAIVTGTWLAVPHDEEGC
jgi:hypothetical protein